MVLRLRQNFELSQNIFAELRLDLENFCPRREERREIWTWKIFVQKSKEERGVGLRIICPSKKGEESKVRQVRRGVRSPASNAGKGIMIESLSQIDSKITACCRFMQPIEKKLVPTMVGSWSQQEKSSRQNFFVKSYLCNSIGFFIPPAFLLFILQQHPLKRLALIN